MPLAAKNESVRDGRVLARNEGRKEGTRVSLNSWHAIFRAGNIGRGRGDQQTERSRHFDHLYNTTINSNKNKTQQEGKGKYGREGPKGAKRNTPQNG